MNKESLLKLIAQKGYDISYSANLNFATYDIVKKFPKYVSFISIFIGVLGLAFPSFTRVIVSILVLLLGVLCLFVDRYVDNIEVFAEFGKKETEYVNRLKALYYDVKDGCIDNVIAKKQFYSIVEDFNSSSNPNHICGSECFAHYKLFCKKDFLWMDEQIHFHWWRDKVPSSLKIGIIALFFVAVSVMVCVFFYRFFTIAVNFMPLMKNVC